MSVGIVGLGYVGLPLAVAFAEAGVDVVGVDTDGARVATLRRGESHIEDVSAETLKPLLERLTFSTRFVELATCDAVLICVPTPLTPHREPDLGALIGASKALAGVLRSGQLVVLESTTFPGTTREHLVPILEESGLKAGRDFSLAFSPERVDPGNIRFGIKNTPKVVGGLTPVCTERAVETYRAICSEIVAVSTPEVAELTKLLENIFRSVNIALVNEMAILADRMNIDIWEVIDAASTKPFGFMRFEPGPGMGGHCLPVDPFYLTWKAREYDLSTEFIELAGKVNKQMPYFCLEKIERALNDVGKPVRGSRMLLLGVAYKGGVGDVRESPALRIIELLRDRGADLSYHDPFVPEAVGLRSVALETRRLPRGDLAVIVTAHPEVDHGAVVAKAAQVLDLRGVTRRLARRACVSCERRAASVTAASVFRQARRYADATRALQLRQAAYRPRRLIPPTALALGRPARVAWRPLATGLDVDPARQGGPAPEPSAAGSFHAVGAMRSAADPGLFTDGSDGLLFLFHLHGFAELARYVAGERSASGDRFWQSVLERWLDQHERPDRVGWHPFPLSGRLIAWCTALSAGGWQDSLAARMRTSLARQSSS